MPWVIFLILCRKVAQYAVLSDAVLESLLVQTDEEYFNYSILSLAVEGDVFMIMLSLADGGSSIHSLLLSF